MKKKVFLCVLIACASLLSQTVSAQLARPQGDAPNEQAAAASVTFTFNSACEDCATQSGEAGDSRYFIDLPIANNPAPTKSGPVEDLNLEIKIKQDRLVYAIPFKPGTAPRAVWRNAGKVLQVFFVPPENPRNENSRALSPPRRMATEAAATTTTPAPVLPAVPPASAGPIAPTVAISPAQPVTASALAPSNQPINREEAGSTALAAVDLSVPESPAFTVLGVTPQTVIRPTSPRAFASSLLSGVDTHGNFQSGLALDFAPYLLLAGDELTLRGYQTSYKTRLLSRAQFSFGTTRGASSEDKSLRLALGLHLTLWDRGDPRTDEELMTCLGTFLKLPPRPPILEPELPDNPTDEDRAEFQRSLDEIEAVREQRARDVQQILAFNNSVSTKCRDESSKRNWNRSSWIIAAAPSWMSQTGETSGFRWNGGGFWTSLAYGFEGVAGLQNRSQLILHARYRNREQVPDPDTTGAFFAQDTLFFGARFRHGSPTFNGSFEYTFLRARPIGKPFDSASRLSLGFERRIVGDTWFSLSLGGESGRDNGRNNGFVLTSFKWAFSERKDVAAPAIQ